jgi:hypothetical protein
LSVVFWVAKAEAGSQPDESSLLAQFAEQHINPAWIEELHELGGSGTTPQIVNDIKPGAPVLSLLSAPLLDHFVLQAVCRQLEQGQGELLAVIQEGLAGLSGLVLAGATAIGRHNLMPEASLTPLPAQKSSDGLNGLFEALAKYLLGLEINPDQVIWIAAVDPFTRTTTPEFGPFNKAQWLPRPRKSDVGIVRRTNQLVSRLIKKKSGYGLLISLNDTGDTCLATLVERI